MNRVTQFLTNWPGMEPTAPTPTLDDLASKIAHLICPPPGPGYVAKTPQTDDELRAEIRKILDIDAMANNMPWQVPTSSSAHAITKVNAEGLAKGLNGACADVFVELERFNCGDTLLTIKGGGGLDAESGDSGVAFVLTSPEAVRALTAALIRLQQDPTGERILETIARTPPTPEPGDDREDVHPDDDTDSDDEGWKR